MSDFYGDGGWTMYPTTLFGLLTVASALVLALRPERRFLPLFLSLSALTLMTGLLGTMWGVTGLVKAAASAGSADVKAIMTACATQALNSLMLGTIFVVVAILAVASGALRVALARPAVSA